MLTTSKPLKNKDYNLKKFFFSLVDLYIKICYNINKVVLLIL